MVTWYCQRIPCFYRCQLIRTWMSNTKEVHSEARLHVSMSTCYLEYGCHVARLRRRRCAYAPTSNTASHDNHEKINSWVSFCFPYMGCLWGSAWLRYKSNRPKNLDEFVNQRTRRIRKPLACGSWFMNSSRVLPTSCLVYQPITHSNLWSFA